MPVRIKVNRTASAKGRCLVGDRFIRLKRAFSPVAVAIVALTAAVLLAGCAGKPTTTATAGLSATPTAAASLQVQAYSNTAFGFSVTYDRRDFVATPHNVPNFKLQMAGVGLVMGAQQQVTMESISQPLAQVYVTAVQPHHVMAAPTLSQFAQTLHGQLLTILAAYHLVGSPETTTLDGLPAIRYTVRGGANPSVQLTTYTVFHGHFVYVIGIIAPTKLWTSLAPKLNAVAQSFTTLT